MSKEPKYFQKRNEFIEVQKKLKEIIENNCPLEDTRECLKKIMYLHTIGIDLSELFNDIIMISYIDDILSKKLIYFYLKEYSDSNEESIILSINTFINDCKNPNFKIRGLALKNLSSIKNEDALEYSKKLVIDMLDDNSFYVKKLALMGCLKVHYQDPNFLYNNQLINRIYNFVKDPNQYVVSTSINILNELMKDQGGMAINKKIIIYLLNKINDFNSYIKTQVLELVSRFKITDEDQKYSILNICDDFLKSNYSPLIINSLKIFLLYTEDEINLRNNIFERIKNPLITLMSSSIEEIQFWVLKLIKFIILKGGKDYFVKDFRYFYCLDNDKNYNQKLKLEILEQLVNKENIKFIIDEISAYSNDRNEYFSKKSCKSLGNLAKIDKDRTSFILKIISLLMKMKPHLINEVINSMLSLIKNNVIGNDIITLLRNFFIHVEDNQISGFLNILTDIFHQLKDSSYICEYLFEKIKSIKNKESKLNCLSQLLTTCMILFEKKAAEMHPILMEVIYYINNDEGQDYILNTKLKFYISILKENKLTQFVIDYKKNYSNFVSNNNYKKIVNLSDLNNFSLVYDLKENQFIKDDDYFLTKIKKEKEEKKIVKENYENEKKNDGDDKIQNNVVEEVDILGIENNNNDVNILDLDNPNQNLNNNGNPGGPDKNKFLYEYFELDPSIFQQKFVSITTQSDFNFNYDLLYVDESLVEDIFKANSIYCMAYGQEGDDYKFYFYCKTHNDNIILVELLINLLKKNISYKIKSDIVNDIEVLNTHIVKILKDNNIII